MTLEQVLAQVDEMKPNLMSRSMKIDLINQIEGIIHDEVIMTHEHTAEQEAAPEYDDDTDGSTELLVPAPDHKLYVYWVISEIDHQNMEYEKENNDRARFQNAYDNYTDRYTRHHMPITKCRELML